jgi:crotonobetainyl-CoA:carnitine CoA-transferase CaiB-like acyl-CoA transferase
MRHILEDTVVLDLGQIYQGPYCGMLLSYMGAEVVKIERPGGETLRARHPEGETALVQLLNPSKRGMTLDLRSEEGAAVFLDLVEEADVLVENFSTGKMAELGLGYEELREVNPELVYAHGSGYGDDGPYTSYPALDITIQAMSGVMHSTGYPDAPPVRAGPAFTDFLGGVHLALGVVAALLDRRETGTGQYVDVGMFDTVYPTLASRVGAGATDEDLPPRTGNRHAELALAPSNVYEAADGYVSITCLGERDWEALVDLMDRPELTGDDRFESTAARAEHMDTVDAIVEEWTRRHDRDDLVDRLFAENIPSAPVRSIEEVIDDPHLHHRGMVNYLSNKGDGRNELPVPGMPIKFGSADPPEVDPSPSVGEHTAEVLSDIAGYSAAEIERLQSEDVF